MPKRFSLALTFTWVETNGYYYGSLNLDEVKPDQGPAISHEPVEKYEFRLDPVQIDGEQMPDDITRDILVALIAQI